MDLGIAGKKALVCGASAGLGFACAEALVKDGVHVVIVARTEGPLMDAAARLAAHGAGRVDWVAADVTTAEGRARMASQARPLWTAMPDGALKRQLLGDIADMVQLGQHELGELWQLPGQGAPRKSSGNKRPPAPDYRSEGGYAPDEPSGYGNSPRYNPNSGGGFGKCSVTDGASGGGLRPNRGNTGRTPVTCLRAAILHPPTWRDSPDRRGVDELTEELEGDKSHGDEKKLCCFGLLEWQE